MTGPGGIPVKGSRYAPNKRRFRRRFYPRNAHPTEGEEKAGGAPAGPTTEGEDGEEKGAPQPRPRRQRPRRRPVPPQGEVRSFGCHFIRRSTVVVVFVFLKIYLFYLFFNKPC